MERINPFFGFIINNNNNNGYIDSANSSDD